MYFVGFAENGIQFAVIVMVLVLIAVAISFMAISHCKHHIPPNGGLLATYPLLTLLSMLNRAKGIGYHPYKYCQ